MSIIDVSLLKGFAARSVDDLSETMMVRENLDRLHSGSDFDTIFLMMKEFCYDFNGKQTRFLKKVMGFR